jgi:hypothetical protein
MGGAELAAVLGMAVPIVVAIWVVRLSHRSLERRVDRLSRIEGKLDAILKHSGVRFDPLEGLPQDALAALRQGQKIEAIKRYRRATGADLREAKDMIEEALRRTSPQR